MGALSKWAPRKSAKRPTSAELEASRIPIAETVRELDTERHEIIAALPALASEPERLSSAQRRLASIEATLPINRRTLATIEAAIAETKKREADEREAAAIAAQDKASEKLERAAAPRVKALLSELAEILREFQRDIRAWERLGEAPSSPNGSYRLPGVPAYHRARRGAPRALEGTVRLHALADCVLIDLDGTVLFRGERA